jgi:hypothetical protein
MGIKTLVEAIGATALTQEKWKGNKSCAFTARLPW